MARRFILPLLCALLAACGGNDNRPAAGSTPTDGDASLPKPGAAAGSVTGMPMPGESTPDPGRVAAGEPPAEPTAASASAESPASAEPGADAAVAVLRQYYAAINARDYAAAYAQWGDAGAASGQTPQQFANGFAGSGDIRVQIGAPGPVDAGAGQRHITIPVTVDARQADGTLRRYAGSYVLHLTVVDGATPEQRSWHIASADLRELVP